MEGLIIGTKLHLNCGPRLTYLLSFVLFDMRTMLRTDWLGIGN